MTANEARELTNTSNRNYLVEKRINSIEERIRRSATEGYRKCVADFCSCGYNLEKEIKEHFNKNGFTFKLITDDVCGGVLQDPYWVICW